MVLLCPKIQRVAFQNTYPWYQPQSFVAQQSKPLKCLLISSNVNEEAKYSLFTTRNDFMYKKDEHTEHTHDTRHRSNRKKLYEQYKCAHDVRNKLNSQPNLLIV